MTPGWTYIAFELNPSIYNNDCGIDRIESLLFYFLILIEFESPIHNGESPEFPIEEENKIRRSAALFILKTTEKNNLPLTAIESITTDISSLVANAVDLVGQRISAVLSEKNIDSSFVKDICSTEELLNPFIGLESTYFQSKYFIESLGMIVSVLMLYV